MRRSEGEKLFLESAFENTRNGDGREGGGGVKLLRSSNRSLEGGGMSVITSSIFIRVLHPVISPKNTSTLELLDITKRDQESH